MLMNCDRNLYSFLEVLTASGLDAWHFPVELPSYLQNSSEKRHYQI
ncbi:hypothetical protein NC653_001233 [Populus alba x Populus x berolinensis]|uniref:Uncharacterized protein n=1 Tax=Populus alba x Populus x berolinensis TaxID=444605 RepID=A0AAD6RKI1_9ROSI|nr:hypothetical protein NC653_001233 [Populus alba x Populus x berolinensis]